MGSKVVSANSGRKYKTERRVHFGGSPRGRQTEALEYIRAYYNDNDYGPTLMEVQCFLGLRNRSVVQRMLDTLEIKGWIAREYHYRRVA